FQHAVSRFMKIIADGNWRTPKGFYTYSCHGVQLKNENHNREKEWEKQKQEEISGNNMTFSKYSRVCNEDLSQQNKKSHLTESAIKLAEKIVALTKNNLSQTHSKILDLIDNITKELERLLCLGASKEAVLVCLRTLR